MSRPIDEREISLLREHLAHWFSPEELATLYASNAAIWQVSAQLGMFDLAFFLRNYLGEYFVQAPAEIHWPLFADLQWAFTNKRSTKLAHAYPRGYGKSTTITVGAPIWCIIGQDPLDRRGAARTPLKRYIILIKDAFEQTKEELKAIRNELEGNEKIRHDYGDFVGQPWGKAEIVTANDVKLDALGTGQKARGRRHGAHRPDLIIADDLENLETVNSPTQRQKVKVWWTRTIEKMGNPQLCDFICLGTHIHYDCFQVWIGKRPGYRSRVHKALIKDALRKDLWQQWEGLLLDLEDPDRERTAEKFYLDQREEMDEGAVVTWPERFPYVILREMKVGERQDIHGKKVYSFSAEMQNQPISDEERLFRLIQYYHWQQERNFTYLVPHGPGKRVNMQNCRLIGACDPSLGESDKGDFSAVIDMLVGPLGRMFTTGASIERRHPDRIIDYIRQRCEFWAALGMHYSEFGIEANQFQKLFASKVGQDLLRSGIRLPITEIISTTNKKGRIESLQPDLQMGWLLLYKEKTQTYPEEQYRLYMQLFEFPMGDYFDGPDALEMARTVAAHGGGTGHGALGEGLETVDAFGDASIGGLTEGDPFSI